MTQDELRKLWCKYWRECDRIRQECERIEEEERRLPPRGFFNGEPVYPTLPKPKYESIPEILRGLRCGAKTRKGTPCKRNDIYGNGRCKFHGGMSTGPQTEAGKNRAKMNGYLPKKPRNRTE